MRLSNCEHESHSWRICEVAPDFRLEDVWALPAQGGADDFATLLEVMASLDPANAESLATRMLFRIRFRLGGWFGAAIARASRRPPGVTRVGKEGLTGASGSPTRRLPRFAALELWPALVPLVHGGAPWALSRLSRRRGWSRARPGPANLLGLALVAAGAGLTASALASHYRLATEGWPVGLRAEPEYLLTIGPYAVSRNPMYVGEAVVWLGWSLYFGSPAVLGGAVLLCGGMRRMVRREERRLEARFGDEYRSYRVRVRRWLGRRQ